MNRYILFIVLFAIAFTSCNKDDTDEKLAEEDVKLETYMKEIGFPGADTVKNHIYTQKIYHTEGVKPKAGEYVLINYDTYFASLSANLNNTLTYSSSENGKYVQGGPEAIQLTAPLLTGLDYGIGQMREGEKAGIYLPSRYVISDFRTRYFEIELVKVIPDIIAYQKSLMADYMNSMGWKADTLKIAIDSQIYDVLYHVIDQGSGSKIENTYNLNLTWEGSYALQSGVIKSYEKVTENKPQHFNPSSAFGQVMLKMNMGGRVIIAMPYILAHGTNPYQMVNDKGQQIVPYMSSVIFYDITIAE